MLKGAQPLLILVLERRGARGFVGNLLIFRGPVNIMDLNGRVSQLVILLERKVIEKKWFCQSFCICYLGRGAISACRLWRGYFGPVRYHTCGYRSSGSGANHGTGETGGAVLQ